MPTAYEPDKNDYFIDAESSTEMARLIEQDRYITNAMGGLFAERSDIASMHSILDLGCGPGQWARDLAFEYPKIQVTGIDISQTMVQYARAHAKVQGLDNVSYEVMDISGPLAFPDNSFDLVNARLIAFLSPEKWTNLLRECMRIVRPGGVIRLTENEVVTTNPATDTAFSLFYRAMTRAGQSFSTTGRVLGITSRLSQLLKKAGCTNIDYRAHALDFSAGTQIHSNFCEVAIIFLTLMQPFLVATGVPHRRSIKTCCSRCNWRCTPMTSALSCFFLLHGARNRKTFHRQRNGQTRVLHPQPYPTRTTLLTHPNIGLDAQIRMKTYCLTPAI